MKHPLLTLALLCPLLLYATDDIATLTEECDIRAASPDDPDRPANVPARYYTRDGDDTYYAHIIHACTQAYEASQNVRYLYQRGLIREKQITNEDMRHHAAGSPTRSPKESLRFYGLEQSTRNDLRLAAEAGYPAARLDLILIDISKPETEQALQALMDTSPRLAHLGLGRWHRMQFLLDDRQADQHRTQAEHHLREAIAAGDHNGAWLTLAGLYTLSGQNDPTQLMNTLQEGIRHSAHPALRSQLLLAQYEFGLITDSKHFQINDIPGVDHADIEVERLYLSGMQNLKGIFLEQNEAQAIKQLKLAAWGGHPQAKSILISMRQSWQDLIDR